MEPKVLLNWDEMRVNIYIYMYATCATDRQIMRGTGRTAYDDVDVFHVGYASMGNDTTPFISLNNQV